MAKEQKGSREPLLFGKKGAVHRAATAALQALGDDYLAETAAEPEPTQSDEQEVMRLLDLKAAEADTTANIE